MFEEFEEFERFEEFEEFRHFDSAQCDKVWGIYLVLTVLKQLYDNRMTIVCQLNNHFPFSFYY